VDKDIGLLPGFMDEIDSNFEVDAEIVVLMILPGNI
jgi:hypothetical protein